MYLLVACLLTVLIETVFLTLVGLREKEQTPIIILVNIVSNVFLNLLLAIIPFNRNDEFMVFLPIVVLEATVVFSEYFVYRAAFGDLNRLFVKTFLANLISIVLGGILMIAFM